MPQRAPRVCGHCGGVHQQGERCPKAAARDRERKARFDKKRPTARQRGYDAAWERESKAFLADHPHCVHETAPGRQCGSPATVVHHAVRHRGDKAIFWDRSKWRPFCKFHHDGAAQRAERREETKR